MIARALATWLETQSSVTSLLASTTSIRTGKEPEGNLPGFVTIRTTHEEEDIQTGASPGLIGLKEQDVEFICEADTTENARTLARAVRDAINTFGRGSMASLVFINGFHNVTLIQREERQVGGRERAFPAFRLQITFWYTEL